MKKYDSSELLLTNYPSGRWVLTGQNGDVITSESGWEKSLDFGRKNDISTVALERAEARGFNWPQSMFEAATEHKNDAGDHLFTDMGNRVTFDRELVTDDDIRLLLAHGQQKFGNELTLTGDDPRFRERMARLADDMGLTVLNPELQDAIQNHRTNKTLQAHPRKRNLFATLCRFFGMPCAADLSEALSNPATAHQARR